MLSFSNARWLSKSRKVVAGIEIGGTTASVAISDAIGSFLYKQKGIPTKHPLKPADCVKSISEAIKSANIPIESIGIASFGPLDIQNGSIGATPKPSWKRFPLVKEFRKYFPTLPIILDTDVNAPAYSEYVAIHAEDPSVKSVAYITIGTGVGVGVYSDGKPYHGAMHPEFGHIKTMRMEGDAYKGNCPFHGDCLEGMISSLAIGERLGINPSDLRYLKNDNKVWGYFTDYLAQAASSAALAYSLDSFVIGGGIATAKGREFLYDDIQRKTHQNLNGYIKTPKIVKPHFGQDAGLVGSIAMALDHEVFEH